MKNIIVVLFLSLLLQGCATLSNSGEGFIVVEKGTSHFRAWRVEMAYKRLAKRYGVTVKPPMTVGYFIQSKRGKQYTAETIQTQILTKEGQKAVRYDMRFKRHPGNEWFLDHLLEHELRHIIWRESKQVQAICKNGELFAKEKCDVKKGDLK